MMAVGAGISINYKSYDLAKFERSFRLEDECLVPQHFYDSTSSVCNVWNRHIYDILEGITFALSCDLSRHGFMADLETNWK